MEQSRTATDKGHAAHVHHKAGSGEQQSWLHSLTACSMTAVTKDTFSNKD